MERIGRYQIEHLLGRGGFGKVWLATDTVIRRQVAVKVLSLAGSNETDPMMLARFRAEAETTASLQHPNIVTIHEFGEHAGAPYIVMEYLDGITFQEVIEKRELSLPEKMRAMLQVSAGLEYAHSRGVIHRDIKPGNVMLRPADGNVKIMDFGIAKLLDSQRGGNFTQSGFLVGSYGYMAPELFEGRTADAQTDIFAFGLVYFEFLAKRPAFPGDTPASKIGAMRDRRRVPLDAYVPGCPAGLQAAIDRALSVDREGRYQSLEEMDMDLRPVLLDLQRNEAEALALEAERRLQVGDVVEARTAQRKALALDPRNERASALRDPLREKERELSIQPRVQALIDQAILQLRGQQLEAAQRSLQDALELDPQSASAKMRLEEVETQLGRRNAAAKLLADARTALAKGEHTQARQYAEDALCLDATHQGAAELLEEVERGKRQRDRERAIEETLRQARLLAATDAEQALRFLREGQQRLGAQTGFTRLEAELAGQAAEQQRSAAIRRALGEANGLLRAGRPAEAVKALDELRAKHGQVTEAEPLLRLARERLATEQQASELKLKLDQIKQLEQQQNYTEAMRVAKEAADAHPGNQDITMILARVTSFTQIRRAEPAAEGDPLAELRESQKAAVAVLLEKARAFEAKDQFARALELLRSSELSKQPDVVAMMGRLEAALSATRRVPPAPAPRPAPAPPLPAPLPVAQKSGVPKSWWAGGGAAVAAFAAVGWWMSQAPAPRPEPPRPEPAREPIAKVAPAPVSPPLAQPAPVAVSLTANPPVLEFSGDLGQRRLSVDAVGGEPGTRVELRSTARWLRLTTASLPLPASIPIAADARGLAAGDHEAEIVVRDVANRAEVRVRAVIHVAPSAKPKTDPKPVETVTLPPPSAPTPAPAPPTPAPKCPEPSGDLGASNSVTWNAGGAPLQPGETLTLANAATAKGQLGTKRFPLVPFRVTGVTSIPPDAVALAGGPGAGSCWSSVTVRNTSQMPVQRIIVQWSRQ